MAKDKDYDLRMQGMIYALNLAKKDGIEALEKDIRTRNVLRAPMKFTETQMRDFWNGLSTNLYNTMLTVVATVLHDYYNFGPKRLNEFKEHYNERTEQTLDLDYIGTHYVTLADYAAELNKKYNLGIDMAVVQVCQDSADEGDKNFHTCKIEKVIESLRENGFEDAAKHLEWRVLG